MWCCEPYASLPLIANPQTALAVRPLTPCGTWGSEPATLPILVDLHQVAGEHVGLGVDYELTIRRHGETHHGPVGR
jgi:hypothetical protein